MRTVDEWIGRDDDDRPPPRVRVRIFERHKGRCGLTNRIIRPGDEWDVDHIVALCNGGSNRESNMVPVLKAPHREKTKRDLKVKGKIARVRKRYLGIQKPRTIRQWRKFSGEIVTAPRIR
jgi:5-methylcytosine-specific restriction protein A